MLEVPLEMDQRELAESQAAPESANESGMRSRILPVGTVVGRYRTSDVLGSGGQGIVYRGEHLFLGYPVALKVLRTAEISKLQRARIRREARLGAELRHPNIVAVLEAGELDDGAPYFVMEFVAGVSLSDLLRDQTLSAEATVELGVQLLSAAMALHQHSIIHRDIKPDNVMLRREVDGSVTAKLLDFGISKANKDDELNGRTLTRTGAIMGTPQYMSPEHVVGEAVDVRSDLYSIAAVLYESMSGEPPHDAATTGALIAKIVTERARPLREIAPWCPKALADVIDRGLQRERERRWPTPRAMAEALRNAASRLGLPRGADAWTPTLGQPRRKARTTRPSTPGREISSDDTAIETRPPLISVLPPPPMSALRRPRMAQWVLASAGVALAASAAIVSMWILGDTAPTFSRPVTAELSVRSAPGATLHAAAPAGTARNSDGAQTSHRAKTASTIAAMPPSDDSAGNAHDAELASVEHSAREAFVRGDNAAAIQLYQRVVAHAPSRASAWRGLGLVSAAAGDRQTARLALTRYLSLAPHAADHARIAAELARID